MISKKENERFQAGTGYVCPSLDLCPHPNAVKCFNQKEEEEMI
jgi:hypothetical protein